MLFIKGASVQQPIVPPAASDMARASFASPAVVWLSAEEWTAMVIPSARHRPVRLGTCHVLITGALSEVAWTYAGIILSQFMLLEALPRTTGGRLPSAVPSSEARPGFLGQPNLAERYSAASRGRLSPRGLCYQKDILLLQPEAFVHQPLQSRLVEDVVGEFFVGKHGQGRAFGASRQF